MYPVSLRNVLGYQSCGVQQSTQGPTPAPTTYAVTGTADAAVQFLTLRNIHLVQETVNDIYRAVTRMAQLAGYTEPFIGVTHTCAFVYTWDTKTVCVDLVQPKVIQSHDTLAAPFARGFEIGSNERYKIGMGINEPTQPVHWKMYVGITNATVQHASQDGLIFEMNMFGVPTYAMISLVVQDSAVFLVLHTEYPVSVNVGIGCSRYWSPTFSSYRSHFSGEHLQLVSKLATTVDVSTNFARFGEHDVDTICRSNAPRCTNIPVQDWAFKSDFQGGDCESAHKADLMAVW
jgi:hypothetical protein